MSGKSIEALLTLDVTGFELGIDKAFKSINSFKNSMQRLGKDSSLFSQGILEMQRALGVLIPYLNRFKNLVDQTKSFNQFALGLKNMAIAVKDLGDVTKTSQVGMIRIKEIINQWSNAVKNLTVNIRGETNAERQEVSTLNQLRTAYTSTYSSADQLKLRLAQMKEQFISMNNSTSVGRSNLALYHQNLKALALGVEEFNAIETGAINTNNRMNSSLNQTSNAFNRTSSSAQRSASSMNQMTTASRGLGRALGALKSMGMLVGSMLAYNFIHHLGQATNETINAKSEMEGYFKMLKFSQSDIDHFNHKLDETVQQFQRVNKYSLGETISSIGVEFNLTTEEMEKAMKVTSMVTSEYLRAGRNANEASLAVKDVLQGQFQRLSRETGVKGEQLKEAGWSGDTTDVLGLMEALEKVGQSRNWDVFAEKANSLNDIVTILQNRFGEWSADMVNVVQPSIVGAFNSIMSTAQGFSQILTGVWQWLNTDGWTQTAVKIGAISTALLVGVHSLTAYRTGATLTQVANMGLKNSIAGLVLGIKAEEMANRSVSQSIALKVLGINGEKVAELGLTGAINQAVFTRGLEKTTTEAQALASDLREGALVGEATAISLVRDEETGAIVVKQGLTLATTGNTTSTVGFTSALGMMIAGEQLAEGQTLSLSGALGALTGAFLTSPIGWFALAVLGLASAFYVASGGLSDVWDKMKQFNETMKDPHGTIEPYRDRVNELNDKLERAKEKYGETSEEVEKYSKKLELAKDDLDAVTQATEHGVYWNGKYEKSFENIGVKGDENLRKVMKQHGYTDEQIDKTGQLVDSLTVGSDKQYHALQVLHKQQGDSKKQLDDYATSLEEVGIKGDEATQKMGDMASNLQNLQTHSAIANSSDDWWEWMWNSLYAGMDQFWIDLGELEIEIRDSIFNWDWLDDEGKANLKSITDYFGGLWEGITGGLNDWEEGAKEFLKPLDSIGDEFNKFMEDPLGYLDIGDIDIIGGITEWWNTNIATPFSEWWNSFDLGSLFGGGEEGGASKTFDPMSFINNIFPNITVESITSWVNTNIIAPFSQGITIGIQSIPILSDIAQMLGLIPQENGDASNKGRDLANSFGNALLLVIGQIPILGDILKLLGVIPQANSDAHGKGKGVGDNIKNGLKDGINAISDMVKQEFTDALNGIGSLAQQAYDTAKGWADQLWQGVNSVLQRHSPGFFHDQIKLEFGTDIPNAIESSGSTAYSVAQQYGQAMSDGISSVSINTNFGSMVGEYQDDAQIVAQSSQMMGTDTTTAFNDMNLAVNQTTSNMQGNVATTYSTMQQKQGTSLNQMKTQNLNAYNEMYLKSNQSLIQMRDSTSNVTAQMTSAWNHMKNQIVASANQLKSESTAHFNQLSSTIGSFYRKIQNPSNWGAGDPRMRSRSPKPSVGRRVSRTISGKHGAGVNPYQSSKSFNLRELMKMTGVSDSTKMDLNTFLASIWGEHGFGWNDWSSNHYSYIKNKSDDWNMKAPMIMGYIQAGNGYKVGEFEGGQPKLTWDSFMQTAEAVFSTIPYKFYYDSNWKGDWVSAIKAGACNCSDGSDALIALANTFGFSGTKVHTTTKGGVGHFYANINGHNMDTTHFQNSGSWTPLGGAGIPTRRYGSSNGAGVVPTKQVHIVNDFTGATIYGMDDLDDKIKQSTKEALREEFNDPYAVAL